MAGVRGAITFHDEELASALRRIAEGGQDPAPLLDDIGAAMVQRTQLRFATGTAPGGAKWQPSERALKEGGKTLVDKARLFSSLTHQVAGEAVEWGTNVVYAAIHQFGGAIRRAARTQTLAFDAGGGFLSRRKAGRRKTGAVNVAIAQVAAYVINMPARPYIGVDADDRDVIQERVALWLERLARAPSPGAGAA